MTSARKVGSIVKTPMGFDNDTLAGVITEVHEVPGYPDLVEYSVEWEDGKFPDEVWSEVDFVVE